MAVSRHGQNNFSHARFVCAKQLAQERAQRAGTSVTSRLNKLMFLMAAITDIVCARSHIKVGERPVRSASKEKSMKSYIHKFV